MLKVMIIDDEPIIVEGLSRSVRWEAFDCYVVATANDGIEGRKLILEHKPDMLFLDISMPEMDGLTMIAGLKSQFPNLKVTILTGFRDFDYAKRALTLGVSRFLLKPSNMDEIEEAISFMATSIKEQQGFNSIYDTSDNSLDASLDASKDSGNNASSVQEKEHESAASSFIVKNALHYIEEHYKDKVKLSDVAEKTYVSQWHLSKLLNKYTNQNFSEILNGIRVEKAKELLKNPALRIGDIALEVGFLDMAHFSRVFKKQVGISANEYRNTEIEVEE